jgi:hypothetical protein
MDSVSQLVMRIPLGSACEGGVFSRTVFRDPSSATKGIKKTYHDVCVTRGSPTNSFLR